MSMKKSKDTMGDRTHDLEVCSAMSQPTAPPRTLYCIECFRITTSLVLFSSFKIMFCYPVQKKNQQICSFRTSKETFYCCLKSKFLFQILHFYTPVFLMKNTHSVISYSQSCEIRIVHTHQQHHRLLSE